jgi:hypothetical protein
MNRSSPTPDDLDRVFSRYFKAQLPAQWPAAPVPVHTAPAVPVARTSGSWRNRLTLAASVAALLAIGFGVSYGPGSGPSQPNGTIDTSKTFAGPRDDGKGLGDHLKKDDLQPIKEMP